MARSSPDTDHRSAWAALDIKERRRILKAVNRGRAMEDRRDARLAIGAAQQQKRFWSKAWLLGPLVALFFLTQGVAVYAVNAAFATLVLGLMATFWYRRADRAEQRNREVTEGPKRAPKKTKTRNGDTKGSHTPRRNTGSSRPDPNTSKKKLARRKRR